MSSNGKSYIPVPRIYDFRNKLVTRQEKEVTDPKEVQQHLVGWFKGLKALTEAE